MPAFVHILVVLVAIACSGCGKDPARGPDAQQLARINKELAVLDAKVAALSKRLDRLEQARQQPPPPSARPTPASPAEPAAPAE